MRFLRDRRGELEAVWTNDSHTAVDKSKALATLGKAVVLVRHPYQRDPQSGSGNCWCGRHAAAVLHDVVMEPDGER